MKHSIYMILATAVIICGAMDAMAIEEASYNVLKKIINSRSVIMPPISLPKLSWREISKRPETSIHRLFRYISGGKPVARQSGDDSPRIARADGDKIKMTAPVGQQRVQGKWAVSFMMPASYTMETLQSLRIPKSRCVRYRSPDGRSALLRFLE